MFRAKLAGVAPEADDVTVKLPPPRPAVAGTCAEPAAPIVAVLADSVAPRPGRVDGEGHEAADHRLGGVVRRDRDGQRIGERLPAVALCDAPPGAGVRVNPWLSKAPMSTLPFTTRGCPR